MRTLPGIFPSLFLTGNLFAGQIANVDFIHQRINEKISPLTLSVMNPSQASQAANMRYMLCAVDAANEKLNEFSSTNYCVSSYATTQAVDVVAAINAIETLIKPACPAPCDVPIYDFGKVMNCVNDCLEDWEACPSSMPVASCGCPANTKPDGNGKCISTGVCIDGDIIYQDGKECTCVGGAWQCSTNCPMCDNSCGCPIGQIPNGAGGCKAGGESCIPGNVEYVLQGDGTTILAVDCPMSGFRDSCALVYSKVVTCSGFQNRTGWGDAYFEDCCSDAFGPSKAKPMGGTEYPQMAVQGGSNIGSRIVFITITNGQLKVVKGKCRRKYANSNGFKNIDTCRQGALDTSTTTVNDTCSGGWQLSTFSSDWLSDFPI